MAVVLALGLAHPYTFAQNGDIQDLFRDLRARAAAGLTGTDEADPVLERLTLYSKENVVNALPVILHAASDPYVSVRRIAAMALWEISTRPDGQALLSGETAIFTALLVDPDIPIRRVSSLAVYTLRLSANSPLVPVLEKYLGREDAVSTIGGGVSTVLLIAAPNDVESTNAVVQYMRRKDQTSASRDELLLAIMHVAKSHGLEIGREVASYADDPSEQTSVLAIETLQAMGKTNIQDNQQLLLRIAADTNRALSVRTAATKALAVVQ